MNLRAILLVRNEADIWSHTLEAALKLFDHLYIVEHWPTDRTDEITAGFRAQYPDSISTFSLRQQGYFQCEVSGLLARKAFSDGADWVFFVDADEFLRFRSRSALEQALTGHDGEVVSLAWRNLMPNRPGSFTTFELAQPFQARRAPSPYGKIVIHRDWAARFPTFEIALGNHSLIPWYGAAHVLGTRVGEMLHIPIRSVERFREKVTSGIAAIEARAGDTPGGGRHLYEFASVLATGSEAEIAALALDYGSPAPATGDDATLVEVDDLVGDALVSAHAGQPGRDAAETRAMDAAVQWRPSPAARGRKLAVIAGSEIEVRLRPMSGRRTVAPAQFSRLPDEPLRAIDTPIWIEATRAAFAPVETTVSSAWTGHVPTLFFLMRLLSPRRYVELGTQNGMSFFAACQAAAGAEPLCECVAVDSWEGDIQAGMFGEKVFADFEDRLHSSYPHIGSYIRGLFDDAAVCFEDGSIDLLHIDGLHTYEAVRNDFVTWLPKMSSRGVVILHDTMVEDEGFGVWKFWREIAGRYPSWNALHTYGLGIALVGEPRGEFAELLRAASAGDAIGGVVNEIAAGIGRLVMDAADRTLRQATADARAAPRATPAQAEATKAAVDQALRTVHSSLSWRVTRPLRWAGRLVRNLTGKKHNG
ncbi:MAG: class I SAM-dependent methyltransferase [Devosia nanyangense]|uniref:Class I SAM-dependent methyltransferase n=1 Tax=Devosia nanyangense TaxID=1228055 RepID=A0A933KYR9_9HYPH|nr:class I SAM-dependent methyltransferase [Devosia nanyangense]